MKVSIQLVSPASGDDVFKQEQARATRVSIQLVSPASGDGRCSLKRVNLKKLCFHSISFPSEWGLEQFYFGSLLRLEQVSIQLVSPASGDEDLGKLEAGRCRGRVSIQLVSPASGDSDLALDPTKPAAFPFN